MQLYNEKELATPVALTVYELLVAMQILERAANRNGINTQEYQKVAEWRDTITTAIKNATGADFDERVAQALQEANGAVQDDMTEDSPNIS